MYQQLSFAHVMARSSTFHTILRRQCSHLSPSLTSNRTKRINLTFNDSSSSVDTTTNDTQSTPLSLLNQITQREPNTFSFSPKEILVAQLNQNTLWDLTRPFTSYQGSDSTNTNGNGNGDVSDVEFLTFESSQGQQVFWNSSKLILAKALQMKYGSEVVLKQGGMASPAGFFYDMHLKNDGKITPADLKELGKLVKKIVKEKSPFERLEVSKTMAQEMFKDNQLTLERIDRLPMEDPVTLYRNGSFVTLSSGPHLPHTGYCKAFVATKCGSATDGSSAFASNLLQRVTGISFPSKNELVTWQAATAEAAKRDHRVIGTQQKLFMFHATSPGSAFMLPHGTRIYNALCEYIRSEYRKRQYDEVITPLLFKPDLWKTSGHYDNYQENMFFIHDDLEDDPSVVSAKDPLALKKSHQSFGLKPMNCPAHCLIFKEGLHSYRDLPVRLADFSTLHRNEATGALTGLTRVRKFHQDDAHIFCTPDQVMEEMADCLDFVTSVYATLGLDFKLRLSTRPEKYLGTLADWDRAEAQLTTALSALDRPFDIKHGDGAFYGPKIDIEVTDALQRHHQCGTIQLDFQLPLAFDLSYMDASNTPVRPVIIHRAIFGSMERMMAILMEHTSGKWPLWLSPRHCRIIPVSESHRAYAESVAATLRATCDHRLYVQVMSCDKTMSRNIREGQTIGTNYICVVGDAEVTTTSVAVRRRGVSATEVETVSVTALSEELHQALTHRHL